MIRICYFIVGVLSSCFLMMPYTRADSCVDISEFTDSVSGAEIHSYETYSEFRDAKSEWYASMDRSTYTFGSAGGGSYDLGESTLYYLKCYYAPLSDGSDKTYVYFTYGVWPICEGSSDSDGDGIPDGLDVCANTSPSAAGYTDDQGCSLLQNADTEDRYNGQDFNILIANCGQEKIADPISILNGNNWGHQIDIRFNSPFANGLVFERFYNSRDSHEIVMGYGWRHSFLLTLIPDFNGNSELIKILDESGRGHYFQDYDQNSVYVDESAIQSTVTQDEDANYIWKRGDGRTCIFDGTTGQLLTTSDAHGNTQDLSYDSNGLLQTITDQASGRSLTFHYNLDNRISYITGPVTTAVTDGIWVSYEYDDNGNLTKAIYADGNNGSTVSGFEYRYEDSNDPNNMTAKYDLAGHLISLWSYDEEDRAVENVNREGSGASINFDDPENVVATDAYGLSNTYTISQVAGQEKITAKTGASNCNVCSSGIVRTKFDGATGLPTEREWANGRIDQYQDYDSNNNPGTWVISSGTDEERNIYKIYHPVLSTPLTITEKSLLADTDNPDRVRKTIFDYDDPSATDNTSEPNENPTNEIYRIIEQGYTLDASETVVSFEHITTLAYNAKGQITSVDGPNNGSGDTVVFDYDSTTGNLLLVTSPVTGSVQFTDYDNAGNPGKIVDANNIETVLTFDGRNRLLTAVTDGRTESREYTAAGLVKSLTDGAGRTLQYDYTSDHGLPETITNPAGEYISYAYDINYNLISETLNNDQGTRTWYLGRDYGDPANNTALSAGKPWKTMVRNQADTEDLETEYEYTNGNLTKMTGPSGSWTEYEYDTLNRVIQTTEKINDTQNAVTTYGYDTRNNLVQVTDANSLSTLYTYDDAERRVKEVSPDTGAVLYTYDNAGNLSTLTANDGRTIQYAYDDQYRLTGISYEDADRDITYVYDQETINSIATNGKGRLTSITDPSGTTIFRYDTQGLVASTEKTTGTVAFTTSYTHDDGGLLNTVIYPSGRIVTYSRDASGNTTSVSTTFDGIPQSLADNITYAPFGPVESMDFFNGKTETRGFDLQYRTGSILSQDITHLNYTYNTAGNIAGIISSTTAPGSFKPTVSQEDQVTYALETGSNRLSTITGSTSTTTFTHDDNGNITAKGSMTFEYFQDNRLSAAKEDGTVIAEYEYNSLGLRTQKIVEDESTLFHYDLNGHVICESGSDGTIWKEYIYLDNLPLAMIIHGTDEVTTYFYHTDHLGTPVALTDEVGQVVWRANYSPFGTINISTATVENNLRFPGQYYDAETGLHYNWHRYYDPETGRYLTPDPIGLAGGINPFVYAESNPINYIDPEGLLADVVADISFILWDLKEIVTDPCDRKENYKALGLDIIGAIVPFATGLGAGYKALKATSQIGKNAKKLKIDEIGDFLGAGKNWHKGKAKRKFLARYKKELRGDTNADFFIDKKTNEILLKSNKNNIWVQTGEFFK